MQALRELQEQLVIQEPQDPQDPQERPALRETLVRMEDRQDLLAPQVQQAPLE